MTDPALALDHSGPAPLQVLDAAVAALHDRLHHLAGQLGQAEYARVCALRGEAVDAAGRVRRELTLATPDGAVVGVNERGAAAWSRVDLLTRWADALTAAPSRFPAWRDSAVRIGQTLASPTAPTDGAGQGTGVPAGPALPDTAAAAAGVRVAAAAVECADAGDWVGAFVTADLASALLRGAAVLAGRDDVGDAAAAGWLAFAGHRDVSGRGTPILVADGGSTAAAVRDRGQLVSEWLDRHGRSGADGSGAPTGAGPDPVGTFPAWVVRAAFDAAVALFTGGAGASGSVTGGVGGRHEVALRLLAAAVAEQPADSGDLVRGGVQDRLSQIRDRVAVRAADRTAHG